MQIWDKDVTKIKSKDRHIFLFPEKLLITKKKKTEAITDVPTFAFKSLVDVSTMIAFSLILISVKIFSLLCKKKKLKELKKTTTLLT